MKKKKKRLLPHERSLNKDAIEFLERVYRERQKEKECRSMDKTFRRDMLEVDYAIDNELAKN